MAVKGGMPLFLCIMEGVLCVNDAKKDDNKSNVWL